jgi:hypothetical protein
MRHPVAQLDTAAFPQIATPRRYAGNRAELQKNGLLETEVQYFVFSSAIARTIELNQLAATKQTLIYQHYYPGREVSRIAELVMRELNKRDLLADLQFSSARIRREETLAGGGSTYSLDVKGNLPWAKDPFTRIQVSLPIDRKTYRDETKRANNGTQVKRRDHYEGEVIAAQVRYAAKAEVDTPIEGGGKSFSEKLPPHLQFCVIDLEVSEELVPPVLLGSHTFSFLDEAVLLNLRDSSNHWQAPLKARRLAKHGPNRELREVLDRLHQAQA